MQIDILPAGWKLWHPVVFGFLAGIGFALSTPVVSFILEKLK